MNISCKHSRVKQYLKEGRAMRIETVINCPRDLACNARLPNLDELQAKARAVNGRILNAERAGQGTVLASPAFERIAHPSVTADGRRTPARRFGDPRVMALAVALCSTLLAATGITSKSLLASRPDARRPLHPRSDDLRPACAVRRPVISPAQPGGTRKEVPGLMAYLDPKGEGDNSMPGKQRSCPGVWGGVLRDPRDMAKA